MAEDQNRRRYPRIFLSGAGEGGKLSGVQAVWSDLKRTNVIDLSYFGAAIQKPVGLSAERGDKLTFSLSFEGSRPVGVSADVVRSNEETVAVQFEPLSAQARSALGEYLSDRMLGLTVKLVDKKHYGPNQDFTHWYHGPNDTNFFLWVKGEQLDRAIVEIENEVLFWDRGVITQGKSSSELKSITEDYVFHVLNEAQRTELAPGNPVLQRAREILSQAKGNDKALALLASAIEKK